jgi:gamma-glutamylcyclotransferase (GGCT)/AIG2-like uncharacterized protein YtfP
MEKVFVYGTLRAGFWNHRFLNGATRLGETSQKWKTYEKFVMGKWELNGFPMARRPYEGMPTKFRKHHIVGEVYEVNDETMKNLDRIEQNGRMYQREIVEIFNETTGEMHECWVYLWLKPLEGLTHVKNGDWAASVRL